MKLITTIALITCLSANNATVYAQIMGVPGPHLLVYKTKKDYRQLVPVLLSADKKTIITYPDPHDIRAGGDGLLPTKLKEGYLIDNRGIGENVAFLNITYKQYAKLKTAPTIDQLLGMIKDKDPLVALCDCGLKQSFKNPVAEVNAMIKNRQLLTRCKLLQVK